MQRHMAVHEAAVTPGFEMSRLRHYHATRSVVTMLTPLYGRCHLHYHEELSSPDVITPITHAVI